MRIPEPLSQEQKSIMQLLANGEAELAQQLAKSINWDLEAALRLKDWEKYCWSNLKLADFFKSKATNFLHEAQKIKGFLRLLKEMGEKLNHLRELFISGMFTQENSADFMQLLEQMQRLRFFSLRSKGSSYLRLPADFFSTNKDLVGIHLDGNIGVEEGCLSLLPPALENLSFLSSAMLRRLPESWQQLKYININWLHLEEIQLWASKFSPVYLSNLSQKQFAALSCLPRGIQYLEKVGSMRLFWQPPYTRAGSIADLGEELWSMPKLTILSVEYAEKLQSISPEICRAQELRHLALTYNQLRSLPDEIVELPQLERLDISGTQIPTLPAGLRLKELWAEHCPNFEINSLLTHKNTLQRTLNKLIISGYSKGNLSINEYLGYMDELNVLSLVGCRIRQIPPSIGELIKLFRLELRRNEISCIAPLYEIQGLPQLDLRHNKITAFAPPADKMKRLCILQLGNNPLQAEKLDFSALINLKELRLNACRLRELPERGWEHLQKLETLDLSNNKLRRLPAALRALPALHTLQLSHNCLAVEEVLQLAKSLPKLSFLVLRRRDYSKKALAELLANLPTTCETNL